MISAFFTIILFFILLVVFAGVGIIRSFFSIFTGGNTQRQPENKNFYQQAKEQASERTTRVSGNGKIFKQDEGEYVEFEEIKE